MIARVIPVAALLLAACEAEPHCNARAGAVCPVAGTGELGFDGDGRKATACDLFLPSAARVGPDARTWVMDFNNHRLRVIDDAGLLHTRIGNGFHAVADVTAPPLETPLENPIDFDFLADGRVVFVSYHDPRVIVLEHDDTLQVIAGTDEVGVVGDEGDGGPAIAASFIQLDGIVVAPDDSIYVSDSLANRVRRIADGTVTTVAGTGEKGYGGDDGPATAAMLQWPTALTLDGAGNLYIADTFNHAVRRVAPDGTIDTVAGGNGEGFAGDEGPARAARLSQPYGVAFDDDGGQLFVADRGNFRVRRVDDAGVITTVAGDGREGSGGDGGPAIDASFAYLARVSLARDDDGAWLLLADQSNSRVRRIDLR